MKKIISLIKNFVTPLPKISNGSSKWLLALRWLGYLVLLLFPVGSYFVFEFANYNDVDKFVSFWTENSAIVAFGITVIYVLFAFLLLIFKKGYIAGEILSILTVVLSFVNYFKFSITGDYLYPWDIFFQSGNLGELTAFLSTPFPGWGVAVIFIFLFAVLCVILVLMEISL